MQIRELAAKSNESNLLDYAVSKGTFTFDLGLWEPDGAIVRVTSPVNRVRIAAPGNPCFLQIVDLTTESSIDEHGIIVPSLDFSAFMRETQNGIALAYGLRVKDWNWLLRLRGAGEGIAWIVQDLESVTSEMIR